MMNLTQHNLTQEQVSVGIVEPPNKEYVKKLLTFDSLPTVKDLENRSISLANYASLQNVDSVLIGGAVYLMPYLIRELNRRGIKAYYSFSKRESKDITLKDGAVKKIVSFKHCGLIEATLPKE